MRTIVVVVVSTTLRSLMQLNYMLQFSNRIQEKQQENKKKKKKETIRSLENSTSRLLRLLIQRSIAVNHSKLYSDWKNDSSSALSLPPPLPPYRQTLSDTAGGTSSHPPLKSKKK